MAENAGDPHPSPINPNLNPCLCRTLWLSQLLGVAVLQQLALHVMGLGDGGALVTATGAEGRKESLNLHRPGINHQTQNIDSYDPLSGGICLLRWGVATPSRWRLAKLASTCNSL